MNKREVMLSLLDADRRPPYTPAAFFLHFGPYYREGQAAIDRHLAYFRHTGMDFVKIQVVNCSLHVGDRQLSTRDAAAFFDRPFMGGLDRHGIITSGDRKALVDQVQAVVRAAPPRFILGADCTVPGDTDWDDLQLAIATAHAASADSSAS